MSTTAPAYTVQDAAKLDASQLRLMHRKLAAVPPGVAALTSLTSLDLSENPLKQLHLDALPCNLKELVLAGCQLSGTLPPSLTRLTALEQLVLSANSIKQADAAFSCQKLVHAGLAYNRLTNLVSTPAGRSRSPSPSRNSTRSRAVSGASQALFSRSISSTTAVSNHASTSGRALSPARSVTHAAVLSTSGPKRNTSTATSLPKSTSNSAGSMRSPSTHPVLAASHIMCLNLSHNDISDLSSILQQLQQMPKLRALHLKGNPVGLLPHYRAAVLQELPQLVYLDGQKLDDLRAMPAAPTSAGQPSMSAAAVPPAGVAASQSAPVAAAAAQKPAGAAPSASAQAGVTPPAAAPAAAAAGGTPALAAADSTAAANEVLQPANTVSITLELDKLQVSEPPADTFQGLTDKAIAKYQQLVQEQQQEQLAAAAAAAAAAELQAGPSGSSIGQAAAGRSSNSGSSGSCPNTARSRTSNAGGVTISSSGAAVSSSGAVPTSSSGSAPSSTTGAGVMQLQQTVPLQPLRYHLEVWGPDGSGFCSAAVLVQPNAAAGEGTPASGAAAAAAASAADAKKGAAAKGPRAQDSKAAVASKARPGSSVKPGGAKGAAGAALEAQQAAAAAAVAAEAAAVLQPGQLKVQMCVPADVATRDWLRTGFDVKLRRTQYQPQPVLPPPLDPQLSAQTDAATATPAPGPAAAGPAAAVSKAPAGHGTSKSGAKTAQSTSSTSGSSQQAGRGKSSTGAANNAASLEGAEAAGPAVIWQQLLEQEELGTAKVSAPALTESSRAAGQALESVGCVAFAPPALLMHPVSHIRVALTEAQHLQEQPAGSCVYKVVLHG